VCDREGTLRRVAAAGRVDDVRGQRRLVQDASARERPRSGSSGGEHDQRRARVLAQAIEIVHGAADERDVEAVEAPRPRRVLREIADAARPGQREARLLRGGLGERSRPSSRARREATEALAAARPSIEMVASVAITDARVSPRNVRDASTSGRSGRARTRTRIR
jgi:hypothetical protein